VDDLNLVEPSDEVIALAAAGRKIDAIKQLRAERGLGLKEAKDVVDGISTTPDSGTRHTAGREDRGTSRLLFVFVVLVIVVAAYYLF